MFAKKLAHSITTLDNHCIRIALSEAVLDIVCALRAYLRPNRFPHLLKNKIQNFPTDLRGASQPLARLFWGGKWRSKGYFGAKKGV